MHSAPPSLDDIVDQAVGLAPELRAAFLHRTCASDQALLAAAVEQVQLRGGWWETGARSLGTAATPVLRDHSATITRIGPYRVVRPIGEGGMGEVLLAERDDPEFRQQVAIKLVRRGVLSRQVQGRLKVERQILASLSHPNIARLLDGGATTEGAPYIVMEYVDGVPIDVYCDQHKLGIEERLKLFRLVCSAVHYAHQNLIVHRDLKPSNILVKQDGTPILLDFGIAKLLDEQRFSMQTLAVTQADVRLLTPDHASPEQVLGLPITTASDTYVLGVLLYELLSGRRPFNFKANRLSEIEIAICEQTPLPPSEMLSQVTDAQEQRRIAEARGTTAAKLRRALAGDLDNIILMAMRKEPERRYASVAQFGADIDRFLNGLPLVARTDTWTYRAQKFVRRHVVGVSLSSALVVLLIAFAATTYVQAERIAAERDLAAAQRSVAEQQRARAEQVSAFLVDLFRVSDPRHARGERITAAEILDRGAARIQTELKGQPEVQASLLETVGRVYASLGLLQPAHQALERAVAMNRELDPAGPTLASSLAGLSFVLIEQGHLDEAQRVQREALDLNAKNFGARSVRVAESLATFGRLLRERGDPGGARNVLEQSLAIYQASAPDDVKMTSVMSELGLIALDSGQYELAERLYRRALAADMRIVGADHPAYAMHLHNLALVLQRRGQIDEAERAFGDSLERYRRVFGEDHLDTIAALGNYANFQRQLGKLEDADRTYRRVIAAERKVRGDRHAYVGYDIANLASVLVSKGELAEAEKLLHEALAIYRESLPDDHVYVGSGLHLLGSVMLEQGRASEALPVFERSRSILHSHMPGSPNEAIVAAGLGRTHFLLGNDAEAERLLSWSHQILQSNGSMNPRATEVIQWLADLHHRHGRPERARAYLAQLDAKGAEPAPAATAHSP